MEKEENKTIEQRSPLDISIDGCIFLIKKEQETGMSMNEKTLEEWEVEFKKQYPDNDFYKVR